MGKKVAGTVYVKVDGAQLIITGGAEAPLMQVMRETIEGAAGCFKETDLTPYLAMTAADEPGLPVADICGATDATVTCEFKNGRTYVLSGAYVVGEPARKGDEGTIEFRFEGSKGIWQ